MLFKYLLTSQSATDQERLHFSVQLQPYPIFTKSTTAIIKLRTVQDRYMCKTSTRAHTFNSKSCDCINPMQSTIFQSLLEIKYFNTLGGFLRMSG